MAGTLQRPKRPRTAAKPVPPPPADPDKLRDLWGLGLLVIALLSALGLYLPGSAGVVGVALTGIYRGLFGVFGLAAPVAIAAGGILLIGRRRPGSRRIVLGALMVIGGAVGLWHLLAGAPGFGAGAAALHRSGGWVGAGLALPLATVAAVPGAVVVLVGLAGAGLLVATATPLRVVARAVWTTFIVSPEEAARRKAERVQQRPRPSSDAEEPDHTEWDLDGAEGAAAVESQPEPAIEPTALLIEETEVAVPDTLKLAGETPTKRGRKLAPAGKGWVDYRLPPLDLLHSGKAAAGNRRTLDQMTRALERTLGQFSVDARVAKVSRGPTVTRFEIELGEGVKVAAVTKLGDDISYALATPEIRIVAPIPGKSAIGIEVPNRERDHITLGDVLRSPEAAAHTHPLSVGIGKDIGGNAVMVNLAKMPHLLIAGATGSGKSVTMNAIVTSVIMRTTPAEVRMILIDPKRVELSTYEDVPHLLTRVVTDAKRAKEALDWAVEEMERRYDLLAHHGYRNLDAYNEAIRDGGLRALPVAVAVRDAEAYAAAAVATVAGADADEAKPPPEPMPYILLVIDELADLMMVAPRDVESAIVRIAQMARAVGIHLIVATQRPSVNVVTGLIKANIPSRIALAMATGHDSKTILDSHGAEKLVGGGDMLFLPANASKPHRIQGCYIDQLEIERVVEYCKGQRQVEYATGVVREGQEALFADVGDDATDEALTRAAMELVVRSGLGSTSMLQRKLKVGFARAGRLMDELETMGVVGPSEGPKARTVLMSVEELESRL